jgi:hypothetical protein
LEFKALYLDVTKSLSQAGSFGLNDIVIWPKARKNHHNGKSRYGDFTFGRIESKKSFFLNTGALKA